MPEEATALSIRELRHAIRHNLAGVFVLLDGAPDLTKENRLERIDQAAVLINEAMKALAAARVITEQRDDAAHAAFKAVVKEAAQAEAEAEDVA
jgi:hypothetical protein